MATSLDPEWMSKKNRGRKKQTYKDGNVVVAWWLMSRLSSMRLWFQIRANTCVVFNSYVFSKFIVDITDISEGKHREETWTTLKSPTCLEQTW